MQFFLISRNVGSKLSFKMYSMNTSEILAMPVKSFYSPSNSMQKLIFLSSLSCVAYLVQT